MGIEKLFQQSVGDYQSDGLQTAAHLQQSGQRKQNEVVGQSVIL